MATTTTIARLPQNWDVWEGDDQWAAWEMEIGQAVDEALAKRFPGGDIYRVGSEIYGPATLCYGPNYPGRRFQADTPEVDQIEGREILGDEEWLSALLEEAGEIAAARGALEE